MGTVDYNNLNLRKQTFLDFTKDQNLIEDITGGFDGFLDSLTDTTRAYTFAVYAEKTDDQKLLAAVEQEFAVELANLYNE